MSSEDNPLPEHVNMSRPRRYPHALSSPLPQTAGPWMSPNPPASPSTFLESNEGYESYLDQLRDTEEPQMQDGGLFSGVARRWTTTSPASSRPTQPNPASSPSADHSSRTPVLSPSGQGSGSSALDQDTSGSNDRQEFFDSQAPAGAHSPLGEEEPLFAALRPSLTGLLPHNPLTIDPSQTILQRRKPIVEPQGYSQLPEEPRSDHDEDVPSSAGLPDGDGRRSGAVPSSPAVLDKEVDPGAKGRGDGPYNHETEFEYLKRISVIGLVDVSAALTGLGCDANVKKQDSQRDVDKAILKTMQPVLDAGTYAPCDADHAINILVRKSDVDMSSVTTDVGGTRQVLRLVRPGVTLLMSNGTHRVVVRTQQFAAEFKEKFRVNLVPPESEWTHDMRQFAVQHSRLAARLFDLDVLEKTDVGRTIIKTLGSNNEIAPQQDPIHSQIIRCAGNVHGNKDEVQAAGEAISKAYHPSVKKIFGNHPDVRSYLADVSAIPCMYDREVAAVIFDGPGLLESAKTPFELLRVLHLRSKAAYLYALGRPPNLPSWFGTRGRRADSVKAVSGYLVDWDEVADSRLTEAERYVYNLLLQISDEFYNEWDYEDLPSHVASLIAYYNHRKGDPLPTDEVAPYYRAFRDGFVERYQLRANAILAQQGESLPQATRELLGRSGIASHCLTHLLHMGHLRLTPTYPPAMLICPTLVCNLMTWFKQAPANLTDVVHVLMNTLVAGAHTYLPHTKVQMSNINTPDYRDSLALLRKWICAVSRRVLGGRDGSHGVAADAAIFEVASFIVCNPELFRGQVVTNAAAQCLATPSGPLSPAGAAVKAHLLHLIDLWRASQATQVGCAPHDVDTTAPAQPFVIPPEAMEQYERDVASSARLKSGKLPALPPTATQFIDHVLYDVFPIFPFNVPNHPSKKSRSGTPAHVQNLVNSILVFHHQASTSVRVLSQHQCFSQLRNIVLDRLRTPVIVDRSAPWEERYDVLSHYSADRPAPFAGLELFEAKSVGKRHTSGSAAGGQAAASGRQAKRRAAPVDDQRISRESPAPHRPVAQPPPTTRPTSAYPTSPRADSGGSPSSTSSPSRRRHGGDGQEGRSRGGGGGGACTPASTPRRPPGSQGSARRSQAHNGGSAASPNASDQLRSSQVYENLTANDLNRFEAWGRTTAGETYLRDVKALANSSYAMTKALAGGTRPGPFGAENMPGSELVKERYLLNEFARQQCYAHFKKLLSALSDAQLQDLDPEMRQAAAAYCRENYRPMFLGTPKGDQAQAPKAPPRQKVPPKSVVFVPSTSDEEDAHEDRQHRKRPRSSSSTFHEDPEAAPRVRRRRVGQ
ncbi:hypothetical protein BD626DRAFT_543526 [Schizophyllum amplum]|uniref:Uncharacterized protein n=1 Tax=Schizophyllum amplum TaxID=97359 RepID=A0A550BRM8_9AGAR|nr:hypothetical protein BD626DRAFT_543526 [Auriculariopsis ampla]